MSKEFTNTRTHTHTNRLCTAIRNEHRLQAISQLCLYLMTLRQMAVIAEDNLTLRNSHDVPAFGSALQHRTLPIDL
jgi:hypothetical protein